MDPAPVSALVLKHAHSVALGGEPESATVADSLQSAARERDFHECFFAVTQMQIPFGKGYKKWRRKIASRMERGREIWYLGQSTQAGP